MDPGRCHYDPARSHERALKVLIIEDSEPLRRSLAQGLRRSGFVVDLAADGEEGLAFARGYEYDVIVLDLMLPKLPGLVVLDRVRAPPRDVPVLILSARDQVTDRVLGLERGADDYLIKPFDFDELVARLRALARRHHNHGHPLVARGALEIDLGRREVRRNGASVSLTAGEFRLLEALTLRRGRVISKRELIDLLHDGEHVVSENAIEFLVSALRRKLDAPGAESLIATRRGYGYLLA